MPVIELEPLRFFICPRCLKKCKALGEHLKNCHPQFSKPLIQKLNRLIVQVTPDSPDVEKQICKRMSQSSRACKRRRKSVLKEWLLDQQVYLLIQSDEIAAYIVFERYTVLDFYTLPGHRGRGSMRFLMLNVLESVNQSLDTIRFQKPLTDWQRGFFYKMSEESGLPFKTC
jgi:hypothetical protein